MQENYLAARAAAVNDALLGYAPETIQPPVIFEAMRYSLNAGGKRLRPIMLMAAADAVGADGMDFLPVACALEMIHTYSLIHDDLPAMDNDDYRRGRLTNHKVYGEAMAILAGDGLLTLAFETMLRQSGADAQTLLDVVRKIAECAGPVGMVGGQVIDLLSENKSISAETLVDMHERKTGALFRAAVWCGGRLGGADETQLAALERYAAAFGLAFQITDDILDVTGTTEEIGKPAGSDEKNHKSTYVSLHTLSGARKLAEDAVHDAEAALVPFGEAAEPLRFLVRKLINRKN